MDVFVAGEVPDAVIEALRDRQQIAVERDVAAALERLSGCDPRCIVIGQIPVPARTLVSRVRDLTNAPVVVLVGADGDESGLPTNATVAPEAAPDRAVTRIEDAMAEAELDRLQRRHRQVRTAVDAAEARLESSSSRAAFDDALVSLGDTPAYHAAWLLRPDSTGNQRGDGTDTLRPVTAVGVPTATLAAVALDDEGAPGRAHREGELAVDSTPGQTTIAVPVGDGVLVLVAPVESLPAGEREALTGLAETAASVLADDTEAVTVLGDTLAHELANHLELAGTYLELAEERGEPGDFDQIAEALDRIRRVADDARTLARDDPDLEPVDLATVAEATWRDSADATLTVEDGAIRADRGLLELCFENLFRNARKYGGEGVTVTVTPEGTGFAVSDDGPGIPPERRDEVLQWGTGEGSGVGLGIVSLVAERHGWTVEIRESESGGAAFVFS